MPFAAKSAAPCWSRASLRQPALDRIVGRSPLVIDAPAGYLLSESLAAALGERDRPLLWVRLGQEDRDPAALLLSLIVAAQGLSRGVGRATLERMRGSPGPVAGWPPLFSLLGQELRAALPREGALVVDCERYPSHAYPHLRLVTAALFSQLPADVARVLIAPGPLPPDVVPCGAMSIGRYDLRLNERAAFDLAERSGAGLPDKALRRVVAQAEGRAEVVLGVVSAAAAHGHASVTRAIGRAAGLDSLLAGLARDALTVADPDSWQALALIERVEHVDPALLRAALDRDAPPAGPWLQNLAGAWVRLRAIWRAPLATLRARMPANDRALRRAADALAGRGAVELAVPIYLSLRDWASAALAIDGASDWLLSMGLWPTLGEWLAALPAATLAEWPWLLYAQGELASAGGRIREAQVCFSAAAERFERSRQPYGLCQSMLAESTSACSIGDYPRAQSRARAALHVAEAARLTWQQGWAAWQLGCLAANCDDLDEAIAQFARARAAGERLGEQPMGDLTRLAERLAGQQRDLRRARELHWQSYLAAERSERETAERLGALIAAPVAGRSALLDSYGWSRVPLALKLAPPAEAATAGPATRSIWRALLGRIGMLRAGPPRPEPALGVLASGECAPTLLLEPSAASSTLERESSGGAPIAARGEPDDLASDLARGDEREPRAPPAMPADRAVARPAPRPRAAQRPAERDNLTAYMLGPFRVLIDDRLVSSWPSGRGRALLKYMLAHRGHPASRDVLMDVFWPEADADAARNSLNVAMHGLRQALRTAADVTAILFRDGSYRLDPDLEIWVDAEEFEARIGAGRRAEDDRRVEDAIAEYETAIALYQGDFLEDDPYEDWPVLPRERLRVAYLDTLDRLSQIHVDLGRYSTAAPICKLILARDSCREDAHRRLMRCYSRLGQRYLAIRQYQACVEALASELQIEPEPTTAELYEQIRRREEV